MLQSMGSQRAGHDWATELVVFSCKVMPTLLWPTRLLCPWNYPGKNTGVGCHFPLQCIFPTQGSNLCLLCWQASSLPFEPPRKPANILQGEKRTDKPSGPFKYQDLSDYTVLENMEFMENHCDIYFKVQFPIFKFGILPDGKEPAACKACSCFHFLVSEWSRAKHHLYFCSLYY